MDQVVLGRSKDNNRQHFIGGSDARIIMGSDEAALHRLAGKRRRSRARGPVRKPHRSARMRYRRPQSLGTSDGRWSPTPDGFVTLWFVMRGHLDGRVEGTGAVFEAKLMLPCFSEEGAAKSTAAATAQHVGHDAKASVLSIITGGGKWVEITLSADPALPASAADRGKEVLAVC